MKLLPTSPAKTMLAIEIVKLSIRKEVDYGQVGSAVGSEGKVKDEEGKGDCGMHGVEDLGILEFLMDSGTDICGTIRGCWIADG